MNNEDLKSILEDHKRWLDDEGGSRADLRGADLRGADLRDANLRGADLRDANLRDADLRDASLRGADLGGANLRGADLGGANLSGSYLRGADLRGADLGGANLRGADLSDADLSRANLGHCAGNRREIKSIFVTDTYPITYTAEYLQIGCQRHPIADWWAFDDAAIAAMDGKTALKFWRDWKDMIRAMIEKSPARPTSPVASESQDAA